jgi:hypothetical protein
MTQPFRKPLSLHLSNPLVTASDLRIAPATLLANREAVVQYTTIQNMVVAYGATPAPPTADQLRLRLRQATATANSAGLHQSLRHAEMTIESYLPQRLRRTTATATANNSPRVVVQLSLTEQHKAARWDRIIGFAAGTGAVAGIVGTVLLKLMM